MVLINLAEDVGIEPTDRFHDHGLAIHSNTILAIFHLERIARIELAHFAWQAKRLPLHHIRI